MMHANPPGFPEGPNTTFLVGALLILAALLLVAFFPKRETKIAALVATLLGLAMAGFRRKDEKEEEEPTKRSEQNDATKEMDATIEDASAGESPESSDLRAWARKMRDS